MQYRLACPLSTPARGRRPRYDQAIEYALSLPKDRCVWVILEPLIKRMSDRFRYRHTRFRFDGRDPADPHVLTVPNERIRFVFPIRSSSIHNLKVSIRRRIDRLGLSDKLRAKVRKGKVESSEMQPDEDVVIQAPEKEPIFCFKENMNESVVDICEQEYMDMQRLVTEARREGWKRPHDPSFAQS